jgi:hypothetical protein
LQPSGGADGETFQGSLWETVDIEEERYLLNIPG